jgi:orotate phosphoribosyltransferase-like protein
MKVASIQKEAVRLYKSGLSMEAVAIELGVAYRTARKAIYSNGVEARDPSARLIGRTSPTGKKAEKKKSLTTKKKRKK